MQQNGLKQMEIKNQLLALLQDKRRQKVEQWGTLVQLLVELMIQRKLKWLFYEKTEFTW